MNAMPVFRRLGLRVTRFKGRLEGDALALRRYRLRDTRRLHLLFGNEVFQSTHSVQERPFGCLPLFWLWLHRTFRWFYAIIDPKRGNERIIGFIGLYGMENAQRVKLSIALFNPRDRGRGYGRQALDMLLNDFRKRAVVNEVRVDVSRHNRSAIAFFRKLGFQPIAPIRTRTMTGKHKD